MRNILIFYNPHAGRKTKTSSLRLLTDEIEKLGDHFEVISEDPNRLATLPGVNGCQADLIIVFGGDGTVRAVTRLVLESGSVVPVAVIPAGSGNLLAFSLKIPPGVKKAVKLALSGKPIEIDVGLLNKRLKLYLKKKIRSRLHWTAMQSNSIRRKPYWKCRKRN